VKFIKSVVFFKIRFIREILLVAKPVLASLTSPASTLTYNLNNEESLLSIIARQGFITQIMQDFDYFFGFCQL